MRFKNVDICVKLYCSVVVIVCMRLDGYAPVLLETQVFRIRVQNYCQLLSLFY